MAPEIAADAKLRRHAAVQVQGMMVSILKARLRAEELAELQLAHAEFPHEGGPSAADPG